MLFRIIRFIVHRILFFFFRHIHLSGLENLPKDKPVIIAASHTYALMDALLTLAMTPRPHYSMTRADIFSSRFVTWLLGQLYMVPIYRSRDGGDTVQRNQSTFQKVNEVLRNNEGILIFPEGGCVMTKAVQPLKKGTARMAFNLMEQENIEVYIIPTGLNYSAYEQPQIDALISFGTPIRISAYKAQYEQHKAKAIRQLTTDIKQGLEQQMVTVAESANDTTELTLELYRSEYQLTNWKTYNKDNNQRLTLEQKIAVSIATKQQENSADYERYSTAIRHYFSQLNQYNITDVALLKSFGILEQLLLFIGWILTLPLYLLNQFIRIEKRIHQRVLKTLKNTDDFFYGSFYIVYILVLVSTFSIIGWIGFGVWTGSIGLGFLYSIFLLFWVYCYVRLKPLFKLWTVTQKVNRLKKKQPNLITALLAERLRLKKWV